MPNVLSSTAVSSHNNYFKPIGKLQEVWLWDYYGHNPVKGTVILDKNQAGVGCLIILVGIAAGIAGSIGMSVLRECYEIPRGKINPQGGMPHFVDTLLLAIVPATIVGKIVFTASRLLPRYIPGSRPEFVKMHDQQVSDDPSMFLGTPFSGSYFDFKYKQHLFMEKALDRGEIVEFIDQRNRRFYIGSDVWHTNTIVPSSEGLPSINLFNNFLNYSDMQKFLSKDNAYIANGEKRVQLKPVFEKGDSETAVLEKLKSAFVTMPIYRSWILQYVQLEVVDVKIKVQFEIFLKELALSDSHTTEVVYAAASFLLSKKPRSLEMEGIIASILIRLDEQLMMLAIEHLSREEYHDFDMTKEVFELALEKMPSKNMRLLIKQSVQSIQNRELLIRKADWAAHWSANFFQSPKIKILQHKNCASGFTP